MCAPTRRAPGLLHIQPSSSIDSTSASSSAVPGLCTSKRATPCGRVPPQVCHLFPEAYIWHFKYGGGTVQDVASVPDDQIVSFYWDDCCTSNEAQEPMMLSSSAVGLLFYCLLGSLRIHDLGHHPSISCISHTCKPCIPTCTLRPSKSMSRYSKSWS